MYDLICAECRAKSQMRKINGEPKSRQISIDNTSSNGSNIDLDSSSEKTHDEFSETNETIQTIQTKNVTRGWLKKLNLMLHRFQKLIV